MRAPQVGTETPPVDERLEVVMLAAAVASRATDIHIDPAQNGFTIRFRVDGILETWMQVTQDTGRRLVNQVKADVGIDPSALFHPRGERRKSIIGDVEIDLRVTVVPCIGGPKVAIRLLDCRQVLKDLSGLGLAQKDWDRLDGWIDTMNGMVLVTGPTASGKTTTLYSLLHELSEESRHVVTIEDPVEYAIDGINQMQVDERHGLDFAEGVRAALRMDPDCVMVGEIREPESALQAVSASLQGHVLLATLHSRDAVSAITRLRNFGVKNYQIATAGGVVVNQRLIRVLCPKCREQIAPSAVVRAFFERSGIPEPNRVWKAVGCDACRGTGYHGRTGLFELWHLREEDYELILADADEETLRSRRWRTGQHTLHQDACRKIANGTTTHREVLRVGIELPWTTTTERTP